MPVERTVTDNGFEARWDIAGLSTIYPKSWIATGGEEFGDMYGESITAEFITPVDNYQKTMRSVKYAVLFLIIPFLTIFIFEIFTRVRIHPVQYCLIGFADVLSFLPMQETSLFPPFQHDSQALHRSYKFSCF